MTISIFERSIRTSVMSTTAEPNRKRPYDSDLRWRVVYQRIAMNLSYRKIACNLNISIATAQRTYARFEQTGDVKPSAADKSCLRKLDEHFELYVVLIVLDSPSLYLGEVCQRIHDDLGLNVSPSLICRLLKRYGITRKKIRQVAKQRCDSLRGAFMSQMFLFNREQFVWVDETGTDGRDIIRRYGYTLRGLTPVCHRLLVRGKRFNAIVAMSSNGIVASEIMAQTVNGDTFFDFIRGTLLPMMRPFDGQSSNSILIMDNCSIHHIVEVKQLLQQSGILVLFLPPYSPDLNPIEEAFSYVKSYLKKHDTLLQSLSNPTTIMQAALDSITNDHCNSWISHAGYL